MSMVDSATRDIEESLSMASRSDAFEVYGGTWEPIPLSVLETYVSIMRDARTAVEQAGIAVGTGRGNDVPGFEAEVEASRLEYVAYQKARGRVEYTGPKYTNAVSPADVLIWLHLHFPTLAQSVATSAAISGMKHGLSRLWQACKKVGKKPHVTLTMQSGERCVHYHLPEDHRERVRAVNAMGRDFMSLAEGHRRWSGRQWIAA